MSSITTDIGGYADKDPNSWLAFPGSGLSARHAGIVSGSTMTVECDDELNVYVNLNAQGTATLNDTSVYYHNVYVSPEPYWLYIPKGGINEGAIEFREWQSPYGVLPVGKQPKYVSWFQVQSSPGYSGLKTFTWDIKTSSRVLVGKLTDFGWNERDQLDNTGVMYLAGIGYYEQSAVTDAVWVPSVAISVPGMKTWLNYFPGVIRSTTSWETSTSCNRTGGYFRSMSNSVWVDKKNSSNDLSSSKVLIHNGSSFSIIAPQLGVM